MLILLLNITTAEELSYEDRFITFTNTSKLDRSITIELPKDAEVSHFSFELVGPIEPGPVQPWNVTLDIGGNGTIDWALKHEYGALGHQTVFNNNKRELAIGFVPGNYNTTGAIYLPNGVEITKAELDVVFHQEDYISPVTELNRPEWHAEAPYDYDPEMCIYQDRLYVAYRSYNWHDSNQSDADIVINSTADGINWQDRTIELTKAPDTEVPYTGGKRAGDFYPSLAVFLDKLYCAWGSASDLPLGSTHGTDRDIVWTRLDGSTGAWEEPQELTAPDDNAAEDVYSENPGMKDDYRVQLCTFDDGTTQQLFAIWTANNTGDEWFPEERKGDIVISKTTDGKTWSAGLDLTHDDRRYDEDNLPQLVEFEINGENALFAFWVTNNDRITNGSDWDIVYRYTLDGETWSDNFDLMEGCGVAEPVDSDTAIDDDPALIVYENKLYVLWRTSNPDLTDGTDIDIVMSYTGNGLNWSKPIELTPETDLLFNNRPKAAVYQDKLAVMWRTITPYDQGQIALQLFDSGSRIWQEPMIVSPAGEGGNDYSVDLLAFRDKLMYAWVTEDNITTRGADADVVVQFMVPQNGTPDIEIDFGDRTNNNDDWGAGFDNMPPNREMHYNFTLSLQEHLSDKDWLARNTVEDEYENQVYFIPITAYFSSPGRVTLQNVNIEYNYSIGSPDLSKKLMEFLSSADTGSGKNVQVKLTFGSNTNGKLIVRDLLVVYAKPSEPQQYPELVCVVVLAVILIGIGLLIKFSGRSPRKKT